MDEHRGFRSPPQPVTAATIAFEAIQPANKRICGLSPGPGGFLHEILEIVAGVKESPAPWISTTRVASSFAAV